MKEEVTNEQVKEKKVEPAPVVKKRSWGGNIVPAFILIFLGIVFLANNLGLIPWYIWGELWRFWPLFLILLGVQYLLGRSVIAKVIMGAITLLVLVGLFLYALAYAGVLNGERWRPLTAVVPDASIQQRDEDFTISEDEFTDIEERTIEINSGIGKLLVSDEDSENYFSLNASYPHSFAAPEIDTEQEGKRLQIEVDVPGRGQFSGMPRMGEGMTYDATIGRRSLPTGLSFKIGAGALEVDLQKLIIRNLAVNVGMGSADIQITQDALPQDEVELEVGMGSLDVEVPENVGVSVEYKVGLGSVNVDNNSFKGDGTYESDNYNQAEQRIRIIAEVGTGSISISRQ